MAHPAPATPDEPDGRGVAARVAGWRDRAARVVRVVGAPRVRIAIYGDDEARLIHRVFTSSHPRFGFVPAKRWGVALVALPESFEAYLDDSARRQVRRKRRRAERRGYRFAVVPPLDHLDEILEVNRSAPIRQGRPMTANYLDRDEFVRVLGGYDGIPAVLDGAGRVRAYAVTPIAGDVLILSVILGHADDLADGTMYLLVSEIVRTNIARRRARGAPAWVMYDTFYGATKGLAYFKDLLGFRPYTVDWVWTGDAAPAVSRSPADASPRRTR